MPREPLTIEIMHQMAQILGGKCLSDTYTANHNELEWMCAKGHRWTAKVMNIRRGNWCPYCAGKYVTIEDMRRIAHERGGKCLSRKYKNSNTKLKWQCKEGHAWYATPSNVKSGSWCPECGHVITAKKRRRSIKELQELAWSRGGECLSKEYKNPKTKIRWRCRKGHEWNAVYDAVKRGQWCPVCSRESMAEKNRHSLEEIREVARSHGGELLSKRYINPQQMLKWRCEQGHQWKASYMSVGIGKHWCPHCAGNAKHTIEEMKAVAIKNGGECLSNEYFNGKIKLKWKCAEGHVWESIPHSVLRGSWCPECAMQRRTYHLRDMRAIAKKRRGNCLSTEYNGMDEKLKWQCQKGHTWEAKPKNVITHHQWCPVCARKRIKTPGIDRTKPTARRPIIPKYSIHDMENIAKRWGGHCLSKEYVDEDFDLAWMCSKGHSWMASPKMIRNGKWCPECKR